MNPVINLSGLAADLAPPHLLSTLRYAIDAAQCLVDQPPWSDKMRNHENILAVLQLARIAAAIGAEANDGN
ncbi:MAG: hypothetical protein LBF61_02645 [Azoarcus sp.]|jgi:hypothetical protein|nr:hypothetical protein [Azoarcus sp.]